MAFLLRGDCVSEYNPEHRFEVQAGHMANIGKMAEMGKLIVAGPFFGNDDLRGIYIFDILTLEKTKALNESDPAIQTGVLKMNLKEGYGSVALMILTNLYPTISERSFQIFN